MSNPLLLCVCPNRIPLRFKATLVGLALAPMIGGKQTRVAFKEQFTSPSKIEPPLSRSFFAGLFTYQYSWRILHLSLAVFALAAFLCILFFFPETSHPGARGRDTFEREGGVHPSWRPVLLNPFSQLDMLRSPSILAVVSFPPFFCVRV